ncbi:hypothetical protein C8J56DRAFT_354981 [Mycena floridula]|nr:hypothetical protein C8J56DRAFT_354981 [Mycena floridula]
MPAQRTHNTRSKKLSGVAAPPSLAVISPTPRALTFSHTHDLSDSPSSTSFDDERRSLSPASSYSPLPSTRNFPLSFDHDSRPQKGDKDYVKRPPNAFFLFRQQCCEDRQANSSKKARQAELSKTISQKWKTMPAAERKHWDDLALKKKREHEKKYPDYVYRPRRTRDDNGKLIRRSKSTPTPDDDSYEHTSTVSAGVVPKRRAASAPGPPLPCHMIQVPNVYVAEPLSSPAFNSASASSPPPLPPHRSASHPGHIANFDYVPNDRPFAFGTPKPSEFVTGLLEMSSGLDVRGWSPGSPSALLPGLELASSDSSVGSCSPGPYSPALTPITGFFTTPTSSILSDPFAQLWSESQLYTEDMFGDFIKHEEFLPWNEARSVSPRSWPSNDTQLILNAGDFDLESIPPLELGGQSQMEESI